MYGESLRSAEFRVVAGLASSQGKKLVIEVDADALIEPQHVQANNSVNTIGEFRGVAERSHHHAQIVNMQRSNLEFGNDAPADLKLPIEIENGRVLPSKR